MELLDTMLKRRSIRQYTNEKISKENIEQILQAGLLAPSSRNIRPCELIVVESKDTLEKLSHCKTFGSKMLKDASHAIVVLGNKNKSDVWIEDCSIVMTYMHLMATSLNIGSCWVQCRLRNNEEMTAEDYIKDLLSIPGSYCVEAILSLGISLHEVVPHSLEELDLSKIHDETF